MRLPGPAGRIGDLAGGVAAALRRRRQTREPRVRVRVGHGEAFVLAGDAPERERMLLLATELVRESRGIGRAAR